MNPKDVIDALNKLARTRVLIGIPSEAASRERAMTTSISNATIGYIMEMGSPVNNVPARPFLRPGVKDSQPQWEPYLQQAAKAAFEGDDNVMNRALNAAGDVAVLAVKKKIVAGIPPPIKPETMAARARERLSYTQREQFERIREGKSTERTKAEIRKRLKRRAAYAGYFERYEHGVVTEARGAGVTPLIDTGQLLNSITYTVKPG